MSLFGGTVCSNCQKERECAEAERMFMDGAIAYGCSGCVPKPQTNADRIRAMSDEKLAQLIYHFRSEYCTIGNPECADTPCEECILLWLKAPVEEVDK